MKDQIKKIEEKTEQVRVIFEEIKELYRSLKEPKPILKNGVWIQYHGTKMIVLVVDVNSGLIRGLDHTGQMSNNWNNNPSLYDISLYDIITEFTEEHLEMLNIVNIQRFKLENTGKYHVECEMFIDGNTSFSNTHSYGKPSEAIESALFAEIWRRYGERQVK